MTGLSPALVLFARVPRRGEVKRRLTPPLSPDETLRLYVALLEDSLLLLGRAAEASHSRPFLSFSEPFEPGETVGPPAPNPFASLARAAQGIERLPQPGGDLGERLHGTFQELLEKRRLPGVVIFGSDSPTLPVQRLTAALERLREGADVVLGPAEDGGYYLIGATRPAGDLFTGIPWGTSGVLQGTVRAIERHGLRVALLDPWHDVDHPEDLPRLWSEIQATGGAAAPSTFAVLEDLVRAGRLA